MLRSLSLIFAVAVGVIAAEALNSYTAFETGPFCNPSEPINYPKSLTDIVALVKRAIAQQTTIKAFGHRHSNSDVICTNGIPVDMMNVKGMSYDNVTQTVTVGAGNTLREVGDFALSKGRALKTTPAFGNITIGGAIGTGAHGSTVNYNSSISEQVVGLTIVDGQGNVRQITAENDLHAFRIHLGLLGIVFDITLATQPLYKTTARNTLHSDSVLTDGTARQWIDNSDQISLYWFPSFGQVIKADWAIVDPSTPGDAYTNDHVPSTSLTFNAAAVLGLEVLQSTKNLAGYNIFQKYLQLTLLQKMPDFVPIYTSAAVLNQFVENPATGYYHKMFAPICRNTSALQCPWFNAPFQIRFIDNEISFPLDKLPQYITQVKAILAASPAAFPLQGILMRFSGASQTYMSTSFGAPTVHFEFYALKRTDNYQDPILGLAAYQAMLQLAVNDEFRGISHPGKTGLYYHSRELLIKNLNQVARTNFIAKMKEYDPKGIFNNSYSQRLQDLSDVMDIDPFAQSHCALEDNCLCSTNNDCASGQTCSNLTINGVPQFNVCNNVNGVIPPVLDPNPPLNQLSIVTWLASLSPTISNVLNSLNLGLPIIGK